MREQRNKSRSLHFTARFFGLLLNGAFILLYLLALTSPYLSPCVSQIPAFFNLGFFVFLPVLIVLFFVCLFARRWKYVLVYLFLILISSNYIAAYHPLHCGKKLTADRDIRIMTYNVEGLSMKDSETGESLAARYILEKGADIVALQEAYLTSGVTANTEKLRRIFGKQYPFIHSSKKGQAILSKYEILHKDEIEYPALGNGSFAYILKVNGDKKMLLVNNHLESYVLRDKELEKYKGYIKEFRLREFPKQMLEIKRRLGPKLNQRAVTAQIVRKEVEALQKEHKVEYAVVLGDLNDTPKSYTYQQIKNGFRDAFKETGCGIKPSYNEPFMPFRIDHLFYSGELKAVGSEIPHKKKFSDHNPLIVDFKWLENVNEK